MGTWFLKSMHTSTGRAGSVSSPFGVLGSALFSGKYMIPTPVEGGRALIAARRASRVTTHFDWFVPGAGSRIEPLVSTTSSRTLGADSVRAVLDAHAAFFSASSPPSANEGGPLGSPPLPG